MVNSRRRRPRRFSNTTTQPSYCSRLLWVEMGGGGGNSIEYLIQMQFNIALTL